MIPAVNRRQRARISFGLAVAALVIALDQASKSWLLGTIMQPPRVVEVTSFFNLVLAWNQGVSFGLFRNEAVVMPYLLSAFALVIAGTLVVWLFRAERWWVALGLGMVVGGAAGNVIDRLRFGAVADFLDFHAFGWHFWAFNIADSGISVGVVLLVIDGLFDGAEKA